MAILRGGVIAVIFLAALVVVYAIGQLVEARRRAERKIRESDARPVKYPMPWAYPGNRAVAALSLYDKLAKFWVVREDLRFAWRRDAVEWVADNRGIPFRGSDDNTYVAQWRPKLYDGGVEADAKRAKWRMPTPGEFVEIMEVAITMPNGRYVRS